MFSPTTENHLLRSSPKAIFLQKEIVLERTASRAIALFCFIILTALGAHVSIPLPFTPVPITLQTFFVLLSGAVLGKKWGAASQMGYLFLGASGMPIFSAGKTGAAWLFGPTGGYIIGFVVTSWLVGKMIQERGQSNMTRIVFTMVIASLAGIYLFGLLGLSLFLHCNLARAMALGFLPFLPGDTIKIIAAGLVYTKIQKRCREIFGPC